MKKKKGSYVLLCPKNNFNSFCYKLLPEIDQNRYLVCKGHNLSLYHPSLGQHMSIHLDKNSINLCKFM